MSTFNPKPDPDKSSLKKRVNQLRQGLQGADPYVLASRTEADFHPDPGEFRLQLWEQDIVVTYPELVARDLASGKELGLDVQALLLYHFTTSKGVPLSGRWISFSELPDGKFYNSAFQGYTGGELKRAFNNDRQAFERATESAGGKREELGDASFSFRALPRIWLLTVYWEGDEDFPASVQVLFDASVVHHLPTDVCAILGSMLTRRIIRAGREIK